MLTRTEIDAIGRTDQCPPDAVAQFPNREQWERQAGAMITTWEAAEASRRRVNTRMADAMGREWSWSAAQVSAAVAALSAAPASYQKGGRMWPVNVVAIATAAADRASGDRPPCPECGAPTEATAGPHGELLPGNEPFRLCPVCYWDGSTAAAS